MLGEDTDNGCGYGDGLVGTQEEATVCGELAMSGDAAKQDAKVDAGRDAASFADFDGYEADVVGVGDDRDAASVVECDVELTRQLVHVRRVGAVGLKGLGERRDVEQFLGIEASRRGCGDVTDVVCAGSTRGHAE